MVVSLQWNWIIWYGHDKNDEGQGLASASVSSGQWGECAYSTSTSP